MGGSIAGGQLLDPLLRPGLDDPIDEDVLGEVLEREDRGTEVVLRARVPQATLGRLKSRGVKVYGG